MKRLLSLFLILTTTIVGYASNPLLEFYAYQVKQIEEFMLRINGEIGFPMQGSDSIDYHDNVLFLFDEDTYYSNQEDADTLIARLNIVHPHLHFTDTTWYAVAKTIVDYQGKKDTINLILRTENVENNIYKWVIVDASGSILKLIPQKRNPGLRISPTDNEMKFVSLSAITKRESVNILNYMAKDGHVDELSVFNALIYTKQLTIVHVCDLAYVFENVAGYTLMVSCFPSTTRAHAGWLISSIIPNN